MSYDYAALVHAISTFYQKGDWASVCQECEHLSTHCPMTPLLWLQYAHAASSLVKNATENETTNDDDNQSKTDDSNDTTKVDILELALLEFPGSSVLHLALVDELYKKMQHQQQQQQPAAADNNIELSYETKLEEALEAVGRGSHLLDTYVHELYRRQIQYYYDKTKNGREEQEQHEKWRSARRQCLRHCPLIDTATTASVETKNTGQEDLPPLPEGGGGEGDYEEARKQASRHYQQYRTYEDDITIALQRQGIETPSFHTINNDNSNETGCVWWYDRNTVAETCPYAMGLGNIETAKVFMRYARALVGKKRNGNNDIDSQNQFKLAIAVYERAIVECPTVEALWCAYVQAIMQQQQQQPSSSSSSLISTTTALSNLESVLTRAVRNCPYSLALAQRRITGALFLAQHQQAVLDPEALSQHVQQALASNFLVPQQQKEEQQQATLPSYSEICLTLYGTVLWVVKQRILQLVAPAPPTLANKNTSSSTQKQLEIPVEAQDLLEDLVDLYEEMDQGLKKLQQQEQQSQKQQQQQASAPAEPSSSTSRDDNGSSSSNKNQLSWQQARSMLWRDGSKTMTGLIQPLQQQLQQQKAASSSFNDDDDDDYNDMDNDDKNKNMPHYDNSMALKWAEKALKMHNPPHPDLYLDYLHLLLLRANTTTTSTSNTATSMAQSKQQRQTDNNNDTAFQLIQNIQSVFAKALRSVGRTSSSSSSFGLAAATTAIAPSNYAVSFSFGNTLPHLRDYDTSLRQLCHEWLDFEQTMGSEQSLQTARQAVHKKLVAAASSAVNQAAEATTATSNGSIIVDRKRDVSSFSKPNDSSSKNLAPGEDNEETKQPAAKRAKVEPSVPETVVRDDGGGGEAMAVDDSIQDTTTRKAPVHKVRVGKLDFPAHPFTVRVSNLAVEAQDMELVDTFRRCGAIVHARIVREKHHHSFTDGGRGSAGSNVGLSKGWGLVQFEERESVEAALELNDVIGLHEKILQVGRSHIPAAFLVPPGMHRVNEKGHGKYSKRNERRKQEHHGGERHSEKQNYYEPSVADDRKNDKNTKEGGDKDHAKRDDVPVQAKPPPSSMGVLSFRPRGVGHQKPRISLPDSSKTK